MNKIIDFNKVLKQFEYLLTSLREEGIVISPAIRTNDNYKPGYHGREEKCYATNFLCLYLHSEEISVICYLENATFGPDSEIYFREGDIEKVIGKQIKIIDFVEFKKRLGFELFISDPSSYNERNKAQNRNLILSAIRTLYDLSHHSKLLKTFIEGGNK